jgi:hypothetical protein
VTVCGVLRTDGAAIRRSALTAMLASSALGLPAVRGVHLDGAFGVVTAAVVGGDPVPPIAVDDAGLAVVVLAPEAPVRGHLRLAVGRERAAGRLTAPDASDGEAPARGVMEAYRAAGARCLRDLPADRLVLIWDPAVRRLLAARTGRQAAGLLLASDGHHLAFGTEAAQLGAAPQTPRPRPAPGGGDPRMPGRRARPTRLADAAASDGYRDEGSRPGAGLGPGWPVGPWLAQAGPPAAGRGHRAYATPRALGPSEVAIFSVAAARPLAGCAQASLGLRLVGPSGEPAAGEAPRR